MVAARQYNSVGYRPPTPESFCPRSPWLLGIWDLLRLPHSPGVEIRTKIAFESDHSTGIDHEGFRRVLLAQLGDRRDRKVPCEGFSESVPQRLRWSLHSSCNTSSSERWHW